MKILINSLSSEQIKRIEKIMRPHAPSSIQAQCGVGSIGENESLSEAKERENKALYQAFADLRNHSEKLPSSPNYELYGQSRLGFLDDDQILSEVIERDRLTLEKYQIEPKQIADRLETIVGKALRTLDLYFRGYVALTEQEKWSLLAGRKGGVLIEDRFLFSASQARGYQLCPFVDRDGNSCDVTLYEYSTAYYGDMDCLLQNMNNGIRLFFPGLIIHLIRDHHFFEGSLKYRVEPEQIIKLLELEPDRDYTPQFEEEIVWGFNKQVTKTLDDVNWRYAEKWKNVFDAPEEIIELTEKIRLYRAGERCVIVAGEDLELLGPFSVEGIPWGEKRIKQGINGYSPKKYTFIPL
ncbi:MAG: hypothetical protein GY845_37660 [Planctomycetes bacterium]|nr:hypothetical protein [Planctomycetota bacterium]